MSVTTYLKKYTDNLKRLGKPELAESIEHTANDFKRKHLDSHTFSSHDIGLLLGNVQAGKTAQMFGLMCVAADASFPIFIVLTTDNVALQNQTYERVKKDLSCCGFCICGETEKQKFIDNALQDPAIIVLKKNSSVLLQWYNTLFSSSFITGNALFIVDDEADAASLNTQVNSGKISTINRRLSLIKNASISSFYLQVTGTPQALLLQSSLSEFRPSFTCYFEPGSGYLGGDFFFEDNKCIRFIENYDVIAHQNNLNDSSVEKSPGLFIALIHHLVVSAQLTLTGADVSNFLIHPGIRKRSHEEARYDIIRFITYLSENLNNPKVIQLFENEYGSIAPTKSAKQSFSDIISKIKTIITDELKIIVMNGDNAVNEDDYSKGINIIIGGTVLGRGVTFPKLHTVYYTRTAKKPQADTMWQHSRMFGYDRDPGLISVFITKPLYKLFSDINSGNNSIISQATRGFDKIQLLYPEGLYPTRKNVIDAKMVDMIIGGVNYYPNDPSNIDKDDLDAILNHFTDRDYYQVGSRLIIEILNHVDSSDDFRISAYAHMINAMLADNPSDQSILIVRKGRSVTQGTGTLLSQNDRELGDSFSDKIVLTMYEIEGQRGWKQDSIWIPNIKMPDFTNFYDIQ